MYMLTVSSCYSIYYRNQMDVFGMTFSSGEVGISTLPRMYAQANDLYIFSSIEDVIKKLRSFTVIHDKFTLYDKRNKKSYSDIKDFIDSLNKEILIK